MPCNCRIFFRTLGVIISLAVGVIGFKTYRDIQPIGESLRTISAEAQTLQVSDRHGYPLSVSYQNRWNSYDSLALYYIPPLLQQAFITSEDQDFYNHHGIAWGARLSAVWQNLRAYRTVRGASTISEQVVRMIHPRPRTLWSKWIESFEVISLERRVNKAAILEFYLNQLPYAANRRGVVQAAHYYFDRDLSTLNIKEILALVVLARAPSSFDLYKDASKIDAAINRLGQTLNQLQLITADDLAQLQQQNLLLHSPQPPVNAAHFVSFVRHQALGFTSSYRPLKTTLDANLQQQLQAIIDQRVASLADKAVHNAAALVVDHSTGEILAWVVSGANSGNSQQPLPGYQIDAVTVPRQPGSALKPFLYTLALDSGWSPATLIDDSPLATAIGGGLHRFKNYSNSYYGPISLREALANSLNIPALRTIQFVGAQRYLTSLHNLGFTSLNRGIAIYDEGLALGNGEVSLLELVTGYTALAEGGVYKPLRFLMDSHAMPLATNKRVFSAEASSLIANILSDAWARRLEFGTNSVMNLPVQTAVKTGTSTDYKDAWVVGFNYRYVVGIWMGNLDRSAMNGVTGSLGPALAMRGIFSLLNQQQKTAALYLSPRLIRENICTRVGDDPCFIRSEYFIPGTEFNQQKNLVKPTPIMFTRPTPGLQIAIDPRIPAAMQKLEFTLSGLQPGDSVAWLLNQQPLAYTPTGNYLWSLQRGQYKLGAQIIRDKKPYQSIPDISFIVK